MSVVGSFRVRLYLAGELVQESTHEVTEPNQLGELSEKHSRYLLAEAAKTGATWMVEVEILNDPTDPERFLRFGTDPRGMRDPRWIRRPDDR